MSHACQFWKKHHSCLPKAIFASRSLCADKIHVFGRLSELPIRPIRKYLSIFKVFSKNIQRICPICPMLKGQMDMSIYPSRLFRTFNFLQMSNMITLRANRIKNLFKYSNAIIIIFFNNNIK
jgi:hypothetical protein